MNIKQAAGAIVIRLAALAGILIAITLFINLSWFDEELHPDLAQLTVPREVSMEGNALAPAMGFWAADDTDFREAGLQRIRAQQESFRAGRNVLPTPEQNKVIWGVGQISPDLQWFRQFPSLRCNPRRELDCADRLIVEQKSRSMDDPRLQLHIHRFEQILAEPRYEDLQEIVSGAPIPAFASMLRASRIRLASGFNARTTDELLDTIDQDIRFWKRMLEGGDYLFSKMSALSGLRNDAQFMSALIRMRRLTAEELRRIPTIMAPLTASERNIGEAFMGENRVNLNSDTRFTDALSGVMSALRVVAQKNATINEFYMTTTLPAQRRASLSAAEFYRQRAYEHLTYRMRVMPPPLYNLGGKLTLTHLQPPGYADYIARVHDLDGYLALVRLQAELALHDELDVEEIVKASRERNPYTSEPMDHDPAEATISFPCLLKAREVCAVRVE